MILHSARVDGGVEFQAGAGTTVVPVAEWALLESVRLPDGSPARVGVLLRLLEDERAELRGEDRVFLSHHAIAGLDDAELRLLGLPGLADVTLELRASGAWSDRDFEIRRRLVRAGGVPIDSPRVEGCFLLADGRERVLGDPLLSLWEAVGRFNEEMGSDLESRYVAWAPIADQLPEGVRLGEELESLRIVLASGFRLEPFRNEQGEPDFDPVLGRWEATPVDGSDPQRLFREALPPARHRSFAKRFREFPSVHHRYLAGSGTYVVLSERLERALRVAHRTQRGDAGERRRFLARPAAFLRDALEAEAEALGAPVEECAVDDVFFDEGLSERVKGVGVWEPKIIPWLLPSGQQWLPEDPAGLQIDDERIEMKPEEAPGLLEEIRRARSEGRDFVEFRGKTVPATEQAEQALGDLVRATAAERKGKEDGAEPKPRQSKLALIIIDNIEQLGFRKEPRAARAATGRMPSDLRSALLLHQLEGLRWLQEHWATGSPGALLADDMGLGKTLQALAFLAWVREEMAIGAWPPRPLLVVAPTGLLRNWRDEHAKHLAGAGLGVLTEAFGAGLRRLRGARDTEGRELATGLPSLDLSQLQKSDWVMTTYETLRDYQHSFGRVHWAVAVFDEAQKIKNPAAGMTDAAKALKPDFLITMTGTPVENRIEDLWSILDAARPGDLGALKTFSARFRREDLASVHAELSALRTELTETSTPPKMLRRLKEDHLDGLPPKETRCHEREMPGRQADAYREAVRTARQGAPMLQVLKQPRDISLHPCTESAASDESFIADSARLSLAFDLLDDIRQRGEKALVFLESHAVQDALAEILQRRYRLRDRVLIINGEVSGATRKARVDEFQGRHGFNVMILSPRAGGVGLTLTAANHVIHLARWWNPAVEDQCTDRAYRIGQERPVHVHHVIARHPEYGDRSFDHRLAALLESKRSLNRSVLAPPLATEQDIQDLYRATTEV